MKRVMLVIFIMFINVAASAQRIQIRNVAVVETQVDDRSGAGDVINKAEIAEITNEIRREAVRNLPRNRFNIMTTETVLAMGDAVLEECAGENCVITLGSKIGADYIVRGVISKFRNNLTLTVEIFETEYGMLVATADPVRTANVDELLEKSTVVCAAMYKGFLETAPIRMVGGMSAATPPPAPPSAPPAATPQTPPPVAAAPAEASRTPSPAPAPPPKTAPAVDKRVERKSEEGAPRQKPDSSVERSKKSNAEVASEISKSNADKRERLSEPPKPPSEEAALPDNRYLYFDALYGYHYVGEGSGSSFRGGAAYFLRSEELHKFGLALGLVSAWSRQDAAYESVIVDHITGQPTILRGTVDVLSGAVTLQLQPIYRVGSHKRHADVSVAVAVPVWATANIDGRSGDFDIETKTGYSFGIGGRYDYAGVHADISGDAVSGSVSLYLPIIPTLEIVPSYTYTHFMIGDLTGGHVLSLNAVFSIARR